jgi:hypothetical protein
MSRSGAEQRRRLQVKVVDALAAARPASSLPAMCELPVWNATIQNSPSSFYVSHSVRYHIVEALDLDEPEQPDLRRWLSHHPGCSMDAGNMCNDEIVAVVADVVTLSGLTALFHKAVAERDYWLATHLPMLILSLTITKSNAGFSDVAPILMSIIPSYISSINGLVERPPNVSELAWQHHLISAKTSFLGTMKSMLSSMASMQSGMPPELMKALMGGVAQMMATLMQQAREFQICGRYPAFGEMARLIAEVSPLPTQSIFSTGVWFAIRLRSSMGLGFH